MNTLHGNRRGLDKAAVLETVGWAGEKSGFFRYPVKEKRACEEKLLYIENHLADIRIGYERHALSRREKKTAL
jgi:hypothetical protein